MTVSSTLPAARPARRFETLIERASRAIALTQADLDLLRDEEQIPRGTLRASNDGQGWILHAGPCVGVFELPTLTVHVLPKGGMTTRTLLYMLTRAKGVSAAFLPTASLVRSHTDLLEELARLFLQSLALQFERGILRQYRLVQDDLPTLRGRLRVPAYLRRTNPARLPVEYSDLTADHPVNRLFLLVLERLARRVRLSGNIRQTARLIGWLRDAGVTVLRERPRPGGPFILNRLQRRYQEALDLAWLILDGFGAVQERGDHRGQAFTFNTDRLYEKFLTQVIIQDVLSTTEYSGSAQTLEHGPEFLFEDRSHELRPDLTIVRNGNVELIVDFKNKVYTGEIKTVDVYQMYSYARHFKCERVLLLYPDGLPLPKRLISTQSPQVRITAAGVNLTRELPANLGALQNELRILLQEGLTL
jgi:5-methylcytosine-specific restriction enzyme subunit McrC